MVPGVALALAARLFAGSADSLHAAPRVCTLRRRLRPGNQRVEQVHLQLHRLRAWANAPEAHGAHGRPAVCARVILLHRIEPSVAVVPASGIQATAQRVGSEVCPCRRHGRNHAPPEGTAGRRKSSSSSSTPTLARYHKHPSESMMLDLEFLMRGFEENLRATMTHPAICRQGKTKIIKGEERKRSTIPSIIL